MAAVALDRLDLVVKWPAKASTLDKRLDDLDGFPVESYPRRLRLPGGRVWVLWRQRMEWSFIADAVESRPRLRFPQGHSGHGYIVRARPGSWRQENDPLAVFSDPHGAKGFWEDDGRFRYLRAGRREFVNVSARTQTREPYELDLGVTSLEPTSRNEQYPTTITHPEARLIVEWASGLATPAVTRWRVPAHSGAWLLVDAFHRPTRTLIEAKADSSREAVRMAIGQLLDYRRFVPARRLAVLLPRHPGVDMAALLEQCRIGLIWQRPSGHFGDSRSGSLTR